MFRFFRQIRNQMLNDNRISKYLLYAIGEIVLVVVGILIALQINNLNEDAKKYFEWFKTNEVKEIINNFRVKNKQLFFYNFNQ